MTVNYVPPPNLDGVPKAGNAAELRATHDKQSRRDYIKDKTRENQYSYVDQYGFLHKVDGDWHTRIALCEPCGRWYQLDRPETIRQRWPRFCDEPCRKKHDRERKRRERTEPREYAHVSFNPGDWLDPEHMARLTVGEAFTPDPDNSDSDEWTRSTATRRRRDSSPEAQAQAKAYLDSLVTDYDRVTRAMPVNHFPGLVEGFSFMPPGFEDEPVAVNVGDAETEARIAKLENERLNNRRAAWARLGTGHTGHGGRC